MSLKEYNELRDFREYITAGYTCRLDFYKSFISTDEALKEINQKIEELKEENNMLKKMGMNKKNKELSIHEIKNLNWW